MTAVSLKSSVSLLSRWRRLLVAAVVAALTMGGGLAVVTAGTSVASAQPDGPTELDPDDCDGEDWIPTPPSLGNISGANRVSQLRVECRTLVGIYNEWVANPNSIWQSPNSPQKHSVWGGVSPTNCANFKPDDMCNAWGEGQLKDWGRLVVKQNPQGQFYISGLYAQGSGSQLDLVGIAGTISDDICNLLRLDVLNLQINFFTGEIPPCIARMGLEAISLRFNQLSGNIPTDFGNFAHNPDLHTFVVAGNNLTGVMPGGFRDAYVIDIGSNSLNQSLPSSIGSGGNLMYFVAASNDFTGSIPANYERMAVRAYRYDLSSNRLTGDINQAWLNQVQFVEGQARVPLFELNGNRLCFPDNFAVSHRPLIDPPADAGNIARHFTSATDSKFARFELSGQLCDQPGRSYSRYAMPPIGNLRQARSGGNLVVSWDAPTDPVTGTAYTPTGYEVIISGNQSDAFNPNSRDQVCENHQEEVEVEDWIRGGYFMQTSSTQISVPLQTDEATGALACAGGEDPTQLLAPGEYVVSVRPYYQTTEDGFGNRFMGGKDEATLGGWRAFNVREDNTSAQQLGRKLKINQYAEVYSWDAATQSWSVHPTLGDNDVMLDMGTAVMYRSGLFRTDNLRAAGLGRANQEMVVTLSQGWNIMAPANEEVPVGAGNAEALFDGTLTDCDNLAGVLAIITYDSQRRDFKILLPCHPDVRVSGYETLDAIDKYDTMYVFFQSQLAVPITWDTSESFYTPA